MITNGTTTPPLAPDSTVMENWEAYKLHLNKWFFKPDIQAAEVALSAVASHFHKGCDPCWMFILGPSSGDKTSICINSLLDLPNVHMKGELTAKTFLSGYTGTANPSLLHQIGDGIIAFKDFTTFISKRSEDKSEIMAQLREIYDGTIVKDTGKGLPLVWKGKITIVAAATPALEREWATKRDLGERFLQVRISRKEGIGQSQFAQRQRGYESYISEQMRKLALAFFQSTPPIAYPPPLLSPAQITRIAAMSEIVAHARGAVPRHQVTNAIMDLPQIENSGRMSKSLASLISSHAALFRRTTVEEEDILIGKRVALNTIPSTRALIIDSIPLDKSVTLTHLQIQSGLPESTINYLVGDLEALGVLRIEHNQRVENQISLSPEITNLWKQAFSPLDLLPTTTPDAPHPQEGLPQAGPQIQTLSQLPLLPLPEIGLQPPQQQQKGRVVVVRH